jgi:hypothetical protein
MASAATILQRHDAVHCDNPSRNFWIEVIKDEEFDTRFRIALRPFRYRSAPATIGKLDFATQRSFGSEREAIRRARSVFGNILRWKRTKSGWLRASFILEATERDSE